MRLRASLTFSSSKTLSRSSTPGSTRMLQVKSTSSPTSSLTLEIIGIKRLNGTMGKKEVGPWADLLNLKVLTLTWPMSQISATNLSKISTWTMVTPIPESCGCKPRKLCARTTPDSISNLAMSKLPTSVTKRLSGLLNGILRKGPQNGIHSLLKTMRSDFCPLKIDYCSVAVKIILVVIIGFAL